MKKFRNLKIGTRILTCFIVCSVLFTAVGILGVFVINNVNSSYSDAMIDYGYTQGDLGELGMDFQGHRASVLYLIFERDPDARASRKADLDAKVADIETDMQTVKAGIRDDATMAIYQDLERKMEDYATVRAETVRLSDSSSEEALAYFAAEAAPRASAIQTVIENCLAAKSDGGHEINNTLRNNAGRSTVVMLILIFGTFVFSVCAAIIITREIVKPLKELEIAAGNIAVGNFSAQITYTGKDEVGVLADAIRTMIDAVRRYMRMSIKGLEHISQGNMILRKKDRFPGDFAKLQDSLHTLVDSLNDVLGNINDTAEQLAVSAGQVAAGAAALADGSQEQAASTGQLSTHVEQVSEQITSNSADAVNASAEAKGVEQNMEENAAQMKEVIDAMRGINAKAEQIGKITKTIEDIAFQTNILALNAAVEAARAGAAGKGFVVVADEVRNLARKSQSASRDTAALIEETIKAVHEGVEIVDRTTRSFGTAAAGVKGAAETIDRIASASEIQAKAVEEIASGIEQISGVVQTNSATAEESAAVSKELSKYADQMKELIGQFTLRPRGPQAVSSASDTIR